MNLSLNIINPIATLISHHKNKELYMIVTVNQSTPFPPGNYVLKYTIHDVPSGNSFDIMKDVVISSQSISSGLSPFGIG